MKFLTKATVILIVTFSLQSVQAQSETQEEDKLSLNSGTIDNQFEFVIRRSNSWQDYKTVKKTWLYAEILTLKHLCLGKCWVIYLHNEFKKKH